MSRGAILQLVLTAAPKLKGLLSPVGGGGRCEELEHLVQAGCFQVGFQTEPGIRAPGQGGK